MDADEFREYGHRVVDWIADYLETVGDRPVVPDVEPGEIREQFPDTPPESGGSFDGLMEDFRKTIVPGMTHWNHPGWFAYFPANHSPPSILAEMLTAAMGAQCMSWKTSPAATELEQVVMGWLQQMLDLPDGFTGVIQDTASTSTLVALLTAREAATDWNWGEHGDRDTRLTVYASEETHSSIAKGVKLAGFGLDNLRSIGTDETYAMDPAALETAIERDVENGATPACVVATVGTTSSTAVDPLPALGRLCDHHDIWLHVDAAYAGSAAILPEKRHILDGIEHADSFVFNPHKWLMTNFDCSAYFVRDVDALLHTFQREAEYLKTDADAEAPNFRNWGIQLGRRFRALKLWFVIRGYGVEGLRERLRRHIELARAFRDRVIEAPDFEILAPSPFGLVCFRYRPADGSLGGDALDALNQDLLDRVNDDGSVALTHTRLDGNYTLRMSIGQWMTEREDVERAWRLLRDTAAGLDA
ncbi:MAG: aspartate aminotransferase family protein [Salinibacter sp.]